MNINQNEINRLYIDLGKFEDALHMVKNLWIHRCVIDLLEEKILTTKNKIEKLENKG